MGFPQKRPTLSRVFSLFLGISFLFVSTALTQNLSTHLAHNGHDQQTHEQTWCSWSCQAGQGIQALPTFVEHTTQLLSLLDLPHPNIFNLEFTNPPSSRGPPPSLNS